MLKMFKTDAITAIDDPCFSRLQREAIEIGIREGEQTLARARLFGLFWLFKGAESRPLANKGLEALRAYAEMARVFIARRKDISTAILTEAGFSLRQITALDAIIVARTVQS